MSERKYRQRGYQDDGRGTPPRGLGREAGAPRPPRAPGRPLQDAAGPRTPNLMGSHEVFRCSRCGNLLGLPVAADGVCPRCGVGLHACIQCVSFDTSARFECAQPTLEARITVKDAGNGCRLFQPRTTVERQTSTQGPTSARQAFDDLFK